MKISKNKMLICVISLAIILVSLAMLLLDVFIPLDLWTHPVLTFLFCLFLGFGILTLALGIKNKSAWFMFISCILLGLSVLYVLLHYVFWWLSLIIVVVLCSIFAVISFMRSGSKTEFALNENPEYKNYEQRKAEKEQVESEKELEKLPEIKSFK